ncbi:hypothetical protein OG921_06425 [Aldersonia sp. NBC_00410]|nr:hypothetical protein [Aldersonia sp. NBC_00410]MCX5042802.1 hypothetical protein [Aldersonia sp. NBC_00410]
MNNTTTRPMLPAAAAIPSSVETGTIGRGSPARVGTVAAGRLPGT